MARLSVAAAVAAAVAMTTMTTTVSAQSPPVWPQQYIVSGTFALPYANLSEPFTTAVDNVNQQQSISYYYGQNIYIYRNDINMTWEVAPLFTQQVCYNSPGPISVSQFLPDMSNYTYLGQVSLGGIQCNWWELETVDYGRNSYYDMYLNAATGAPVQLEILGRNTVTGSHFDHYIISYNGYTPVTNNNFPAGTFSQPKAQCTAFPQPPGVMQAEGNALVQEVIPQGDGSEPLGPMNDPHWAAFVETYGKSYSDEQEADERHAIFTRSRRMIMARNRAHKARGSSLRLAMNQMGDFNAAEWSLRRGKRADGSSHRVDRHAQMAAENGGVFFNGATGVHAAPSAKERANLPNSVDWRTVGAVEPVEDQAFCGSCWSFGSTASIAGIAYLASNNTNMTVMSKQTLVDCSWTQGNDGCDGGEDFLGYQWMMANGGLPSRAAYGPYLGMDGYCHANVTAKAVQISGYVNVTSGSESALLSALANIGPISISIDAALDSFGYYSSGVYDDPACSNQMADQDHTVNAVGYGTDPVSGLDYWIVKNSWSTYWGDNGFILIARENNVCGVTLSPTYVNLA